MIWNFLGDARVAEEAEGMQRRLPVPCEDLRPRGRQSRPCGSGTGGGLHSGTFQN